MNESIEDRRIYDSQSFQHIETIFKALIIIDQKLEIMESTTIKGIDDIQTDQKIWLSMKYTMNEFAQLVKLLNSDNAYDICQGCVGIRLLLSIQQQDIISFAINSAIEANIIPRVIKLLSNNECIEIQLEAAWILTNIASGNAAQIQTIIECNGIKELVALLTDAEDSIIEQACWALGNIAGDNSHYRDLILEAGVLEHMISFAEQTTKKQTIICLAWSLSNLIRVKPIPSIEIVECTIPIFVKFIAQQSDIEIVRDSLWSLTYLLDLNDDECEIKYNKKLDYFIQSGGIENILKHLNLVEQTIQIPALRCLGNISAGTSKHTNAILQKGVLKVLKELINNEQSVIRRQVCWILCNITAEQNYELVINDDDLIKSLVRIIDNDAEITNQREAIWVLCNSTNHLSETVEQQLLEIGIFQKFDVLLRSTDIKVVQVIFDALQNLFQKEYSNKQFSDQGKVYLAEIERLGTKIIIEQFSNEDESGVSEKASQILSYLNLQI